MSTIATRQAQLEERCQRYEAAPPDERLQRQILTDILRDCAYLMIQPRELLTVQSAQRRRQLLTALDAATTGATIRPESPGSYLCPGCGRGFDTTQARAGHMAHCQKGGPHE